MLDLIPTHTEATSAAPIQENENWSDKAQRGAFLIEGAKSGFCQAAKEAFSRDHLTETVGKLALSAGIGFTMSKFAPAAGLAGMFARSAGIGMAISFVAEAAVNGGRVVAAAADGMSKGGNLGKDVSVMQSCFGRFGFDSLIMTAGALAGGGLGNGFFKPAQSIGESSIEKTNYHGWKNSIRLDNGKVSAIIVPQTGRIASFSLAGKENVFWENPALFGQSPEPSSVEWRNFGGDKSWPAPQENWPRMNSREWPPPTAFDQMPVTVEINQHGIKTTSVVDPDFGIRMVRQIALRPHEPAMDVTTSYEKVEGKPVQVGVWTITQLKEPRSVVVPLPATTTTTMENGFITQMGTDIPSMKQSSNALSFQRDRSNPHKIGTESSSLYWVGEDSVLHISSPRGTGTYPDGGSSAEVYTNPDPLPYVELEMLGPLATLNPGESTAETVTYKLSPRSSSAVKLIRELLSQS